MATRVAVDDSLSPVRRMLLAEGFDVVGLAPAVPEGVAAIVVNGLEDAFMGAESIRVQVPIIDATGRTPQQVAADVAACVRGGHA